MQMQIIFGVLSRRGLDTFLLPQRALLLLTGFPDARQAANAATNFIVNVRQLGNNAQVAVTGIRRAIGQLPAIEMSDINLSGALTQHFMASDEFRKDLSSAEPAAKAEFHKHVGVKKIARKPKAPRKKGSK